MNPTDPPPDALPGAVQASWHRFADLYEPLRSELYRYCRYLTHSPWDAEDLAQDAMARAFVTLGRMGTAPPNPRAWLFRVASNLWIDQTRRDARATRDRDPLAVRDPIDERAPREAAGTLLVQLSPQERAAVVLKDVFDLELDEIAATLSTTRGAVKAALHRGRGKLVDPDATAPRTPARGALDAFCAAFNARDLERLTALLLDTATVEVIGASASFGPDEARARALGGMLFGSARLAEADRRGGIEPRFMQGVLATPPRAEVRVHRGEPIVLCWYAHHDGDAVRAIDRIETDLDGEHITRLANYFFTPDALAEVCGELAVPFRSNGYRWWLPAGPC
jgi:RNA polymerase sigma-70 factor, ECF subfamily